MNKLLRRARIIGKNDPFLYEMNLYVEIIERYAQPQPEAMCHEIIGGKRNEILVPTECRFAHIKAFVPQYSCHLRTVDPRRIAFDAAPDARLFTLFAIQQGAKAALDCAATQLAVQRSVKDFGKGILLFTLISLGHLQRQRNDFPYADEITSIFLARVQRHIEQYRSEKVARGVVPVLVIGARGKDHRIGERAGIVDVVGIVGGNQR
nr:hypothetical protein [Bradyrhizobium brasilense]